MSEPRPLHRLFGLSWIDFFEGTSVDVDTELDLSVKKQLLDLAFSRKEAEALPRPLPDGFEDLATHNLVTFKSYQEALDVDALWELIAHFVNHRKQVSPSMDAPLPARDFRLFAVCVRFPHNLAQDVTLMSLRPGVYEIQGLALRFRVIVVHQLPLAEHNAMLHLFSAREEPLRYAQQHYRPHSQQTSTLLYQLFKAYWEDQDMSDKLKEFVRQTIDEMVASLPAEERLKGLSVEDRLKDLSVEDRLKDLSAEERLKDLPAEERLKGLSAEEVARGLSPETLEALARHLKANGPSSTPK